jgi:hypothetical protein
MTGSRVEEQYIIRILQIKGNTTLLWKYTKETVILLQIVLAGTQAWPQKHERVPTAQLQLRKAGHFRGKKQKIIVPIHNENTERVIHCDL